VREKKKAPRPRCENRNYKYAAEGRTKNTNCALLEG
jgi:hypothetical protein